MRGGISDEVTQGVTFRANRSGRAADTLSRPDRPDIISGLPHPVKALRVAVPGDFSYARTGLSEHTDPFIINGLQFVLNPEYPLHA